MKWVRGDVCVRWGRRKKKGRVHGWWGKKKKGKKKWEVGFTVEKKKGMKNKEEKKFEREKTKLILFICLLCLV